MEPAWPVLLSSAAIDASSGDSVCIVAPVVVEDSEELTTTKSISRGGW